MRVEHRLLEIGTDDLAMSLTEAHPPARARPGSSCPTRGPGRWCRQTEGWPAALYLAALALRAARSPADGSFTGTDRLMSDYLRSEVLDRLSRSQRRLPGPYVDPGPGERAAVRCRRGWRRRDPAARAAAAPEPPGACPLDRRGEWYRYHHLLRQLLQAELRAESPDLVPELHARAAAWFEAQRRARAARSTTPTWPATPDRSGDWCSRRCSRSGPAVRSTRSRDWMERLGRRSPAPHTPAMIAHGALIFALLGRAGRRRALGRGRRGAAGHRHACPTAARSRARWPTCGRTCAATARPTMRRGRGRSARRARPDQPLPRHDAPHRGAVLPARGRPRAGRRVVRARLRPRRRASRRRPSTALVLAEQFQVAVERDDWTAAESLIKRALEIVARGPFDDYWTSALLFASAARAAAHRGDMSEAREHARRAARLRPLLTYALPVVSVQALVELARAYLALVDPAGARAVLEQVRGILQQRPDLGTLATAARRLDERVSQITAATPVGASSLTAAELRLVPLLPTHLTYPEIGERLFISRHTVKTQAGSVYRKLGASSRKEAVERIIELGLLV